VRALDGVGFAVSPGERFGLIGDSGSGKSTIALALMRLIRPPGRIVSGESWLDDLPVIPVVEAPALVPFNNTYWTGWPTARDPWNMPVTWWATFNLVLNGYPDPKNPGKWIGGIKPAK
jgi:ABC-type dipeptide/oligopeptide/nickel transport system ATPase component